jgi:RNA polymerase sigma-70 factor (ECF subfamily)
MVQDLLLRLPEDQRIAVVLKKIHNLSYDAIADILGESMGTIQSRVYYGLKKMREYLEGQMLKNFTRD